ncbi:engulfment and cell motility protein 1-like [Argonauta hians]
MDLGGGSSTLPSSRTSIRTTRPTSENIRKVAVTMNGRQAQFLELDQTRPLLAIMHDICKGWQLTDTENYALQFTESNRQNYITEKNRGEIQTGTVLKLTSSPVRTSQEVYDKLKDQDRMKKLEALKQLSTLSTDGSFAQEFIGKQGLHLLTSIVNNREQYAGPPLAFCLKSFVSLMDHNIVSWDIVDELFIQKVASTLDDETCYADNNVDNTCLQTALEIIEAVLLNSDKYKVVEQFVTPGQITKLMTVCRKSSELHKNFIAVINALLMKADRPKHKEIAESLQSKMFRNIILDHVIMASRVINNDMAHQLSVLQTLMLNLNEERMKSLPDPNKNINDIVELRRVAFDFDGDVGSRKTMTVSRDFAKDAVKDAKKLGFKNVARPLEDFSEVPPGVLALDCMLYFARNHTDSYIKVVLENCCRADEHDCPFTQTSIHLTRILCEILKIGEPPSEDGHVYYRMFFTHDKPFEEFFCSCIQLWSKSWKEMRATTEDFSKVLSVVREQITRGLAQKPMTFDDFKERLKQFTYAEILKSWEKERQNKEAWESQAEPIVELRKQITPDIKDMIRRQRLNYLMSGSLFCKITKGGKLKEKHWWQLSPNLKTFHYGDWNSENTPTLEQLPNKLSVADIKCLVAGKECAHIKENRKKNIAADLYFSIIPVTTIPQNFLAGSQLEFDMWTDGINALLRNKMVSGQEKSDMEMLLGMEIKLRLLDTEGVQIPAKPPPVPPLPDNYNFVY